jgi:TOTE conflict system primase-like protein
MPSSRPGLVTPENTHYARRAFGNEPGTKEETPRDTNCHSPSDQKGNSIPQLVSRKSGPVGREERPDRLLTGGHSRLGAVGSTKTGKKKSFRLSKPFPLSDEVVRDHLLGKQTIGIYPLLQDDTCWFVAVDFDKRSWEGDACAFLRTCRETGVPASLERSRSGNGGHVWIFFAEPIQAALARKRASAILTRTIAPLRQGSFLTARSFGSPASRKTRPQYPREHSPELCLFHLRCHYFGAESARLRAGFTWPR